MEPRRDGMLIEIAGLGKLFPTADGGTLEALRGVDLRIGAGEFVSFVGPSGCGKSTLLNVIGGLLEPTLGEVRFRGEALTRPRREIGMMFQSPVLFPWRTVLDNVLLPIEILGGDRRAYAARAEEVLRLVGLEGFARAYPRQLSGGMQQRAALSRVLIYDPEVLLLDEPFGALDEFTREAMNIELLRIWERTRKTILFVTHNIGEAVFLSQRVVVMTPRPGQVADVIEIDLAVSRTREVMRTPDYSRLCFAVRELLGVAR